MSAHAPVAPWRRLLSFVVGTGIPTALMFPLRASLPYWVALGVAGVLAYVITWGILAATEPRT